MRGIFATTSLAGLLSILLLAGDAQACHKKQAACTPAAPACAPVVVPVTYTPCPPPAPAPTCAPAPKRKHGGGGLFGGLFGGGRGHGHKQAAAYYAPAPYYAAPVAYPGAACGPCGY